VPDRHHPFASQKYAHKKINKNIFEKWHFFRRQKPSINAPRFTTQSTTTSPQKHHSKTPFFPKTTRKNALHHKKQKMPKETKK
jgi:hypothetical protein